MKTKLQEIQEKRGAYTASRRRKFDRMTSAQINDRHSLRAGIPAKRKKSKAVMPRSFKVETIGYKKPGLLNRFISRFKKTHF